MEMVYFWDYNSVTLKSMCQQKLYPPGFTIEVGTNEYDCKDAEMKVVFPGAKYCAVKINTFQENEVEFFIGLKKSHANPDAAKCKFRVFV